MNKKEYNISIKKEDIDFLELANLLGYHGMDIPEPFWGIVKTELSLLSETFQCKGGYVIYDDIKFNQHSLQVKDCEFNLKKIVAGCLDKSKKIAVFACTAGQGVEDKSREYAAKGKPMEAYIVDMLGSVIADKAMDKVQSRLKEEVKADGYAITNRYSPGYCNWDVSEQKKLFSLLPKHFCGISLSSSCLMKPIKSVSGFIGIGEDVCFQEYQCENCDMKTCIYRDTKKN